jgi:hypothetical protein
VLVAAAAACAKSAPPPEAPVAKGNLHALNVTGMAEAIVKGVRIVPESIDESRTYGVEPGGGLRSIVAGIRVVNYPSGAIQSSLDRLPSGPTTTVALPDRVGGGFLFQIGNVLWRGDRWLAQAKPIFTSPQPIQAIVPGLDRVYVRTSSGTHLAIDARTGAMLDMGAWPSSPTIGAYAASDGWRAVAIADLRGVVATFDAGSTWRTLALPIAARDVIVSDGALTVSGTDQFGAWQYYEVRGDGQVGRLGGPPVPDAAPEKPAAQAIDPAARPFGPHPLASAIEDGWPLSDGTAIVARDGAIARVRLADGALVEASSDAYPLKPSHCHPVSLARPKEEAAFGFVCGETKGATALYRYDTAHGRMVELRKWNRPREILSSGNGAIAVRGACAETAPGEDADRAQQSYCILARGKSDDWREIRVRGDIGGERLVVLADGRVAVVSPPHGDLATARVTILDKGKAATVAIQFPTLSVDVARVLKNGVWMDGFEERRPGVLGGWVEAAGTLLGIEVALDGKATLGRYVRDLGTPMVSGRFGLGFTGARRGYETTDGGITWTDIELPEPIVHPRAVTRRACGPVGCNAAGWLRVGWGAASGSQKMEAPPAPRVASSYGTSLLDLDCEPVAGPPPDPPKPPTAKKPADARIGIAAIGSAAPAPYFGGYYYGGYGYGYGYGSGYNGVTELPAFFSTGSPAVPTDNLGFYVDTRDTLDHARNDLFARIYTYGPKSSDWERAGKWWIRWSSPFGAWNDVRSTAMVTANFGNVDGARRALGMGTSGPTAWSFAAGDDDAHALIIGRRSTGTGMEAVVYSLEADRAPIEVRRGDGEPLLEVDAAVRMGGRWFVSSSQAARETPATVLWAIEGSVAREVARVPRAGVVGKPTVRLARRSDGRAIGLVVEGQPFGDQVGAQRWILPIDGDSFVAGEPERIGAADMRDRPLKACSHEGLGWVFDVAAQATARLHLDKNVTVNAASPLLARVRVARDTACVERAAGNLDYSSSRSVESLTRKKTDAAPREMPDAITIAVTQSTSRQRYGLRCQKR